MVLFGQRIHESKILSDIDRATVVAEICSVRRGFEVHLIARLPRVSLAADGVYESGELRSLVMRSERNLVESRRDTRGTLD